MNTRKMLGWTLGLLLLGGCVLERVEVEGPYPGWDTRTTGPGASVGGLRQVPLESVEMGGIVAERRAAGRATGSLLLEEGYDGRDWLRGQFEGPASGRGAVMVAPSLPLRALQEARESGGRVVFISAAAEPGSGYDYDDPEVDEMPGGDAIVCSGPNRGEWVEEAWPTEGAIEVEPSENEGLEVATVRLRVEDEYGNVRLSWVRFEYDPVLLDGGEGTVAPTATY